MLDTTEFPIEYTFTPSPEAEEQLADVYQLICDLILADLENECLEENQGEA